MYPKSLLVEIAVIKRGAWLNMILRLIIIFRYLCNVKSECFSEAMPLKIDNESHYPLIIPIFLANVKKIAIYL